MLAGATLHGTGTLAGLLTWTGGQIGNGNNTMTVAANATLVLAGTNGSNYVLSQPLNNAGTILLESGNVDIIWCGGGNYGGIVNLPGGLVEMAADVSIIGDGCALGFNNQGMVRKSGGTNTSAISQPFANQGGSIEVDTGTLSLGSSSYSQGGGALIIDLGGTNSGQSGEIVTSGSAALNGPLIINLTNGFQPGLGNQFRILSNSTRSGTFTSTNIGGISVVYSTTGVVLAVTNSTLGPLLSWATPSAITYGTALNSNQLNATSTLPGTFAYTPTNGTIFHEGAHTLSVVFTPTDTVHYSSVSETVTLVVTPAPLTITANNFDITFGSVLPTLSVNYSGFVNGDNAASLNGTPALATTATNGSPGGSYPITVALGTINDTNYTYIFVPGTLTIQQYGCLPPFPGLISWYPGNGNFLDVVSGFNGVPYNTVSFAPAVVGEGFVLQGSCVVAAGNFSFPSNQMTIECWFKLNTLNGGYNGLVSSQDCCTYRLAGQREWTIVPTIPEPTPTFLSGLLSTPTSSTTRRWF